MLGPAGGTIPPPAALDQIGRLPAIRTEAVARVPVQQRLAFRDRRQVGAVDQFLDGDRPQIGHDELIPRLQGFDGRHVGRHREPSGVAQPAEKDEFLRLRQRSRLCQREQRAVYRRLFLQHHHLAANDINAGARIIRERCERGRIGAQFGCSIDQALRIAEARLGAEIGARGHETSGGSSTLAQRQTMRNIGAAQPKATSCRIMAMKRESSASS